MAGSPQSSKPTGRSGRGIGALLRQIVPPRSETSAVGMTVVMAGFVGIGAGLLALLIEWLIFALNAHVFMGLGPTSQTPFGTWSLLLALIPAAVFVAVAWALRRWAPETIGGGTAQVISSVGHRGGFIRRRVIPLKVLGTALGIGAGAPLGMEGPAIYTGAAVGSLIGRRSHMAVSNTRILVGAGAAAALAAKYNAPIGGAVFTSELILGSAGASALLPLITAAFMGVLARHAVWGNAPEYFVPSGMTFSGRDYLAFVALGLACGLVAAYFIKVLFACEDHMSRLFKQWWARAAFGGLAVGLMALLLPELLGTGRPVIQRMIREPDLSLRVLVLFILLKPILCAVAMGSGVSGGVFAPTLFTGAAVGALLANVLPRIGVLELAPGTAYVMAGMAGVMGATMRAPLQAVLVTFELAQEYSLIPPLMITCVVALKVSELFEPESVFTRRLVRGGERMKSGMDFGLLEGVTVADVMDGDYVALPVDAALPELAEPLRKAENRTFPVADRDGRLCGIVTLARLIAGAARAQQGGALPELRSLLEPEQVFLCPGDSLEHAWEVMLNYDYDCLPVCHAGTDGLQIVGICEREAIVEMDDRQAFIRLTRDQ